jgi:ribose transport system permease protein
MSDLGQVAPEQGAAGQAASTAERPARTRVTGSGFLARYTLLLVLIVVVVAFSLARPETFPTYTNLVAILSSQTVLLMLALGALFPLVAGEFDLSVGYALGFTAMLLAVLAGKHGVPVVPAMIIAVLVGGVIGAINGFLVIRLRVNAFIATLASGTVLQGLTLWLSDGQVVANLPASISDIGRLRLADMPVLVFIVAAVAVIVGFVLEKTPGGRYMYATGLGREAARLAGVKTSVLLAVAFVVSGLMAGVAGVMQTTVLGAANPDVGAQYLLPVFAAGFLGATAIRPGRFNVGGTVLALLLLAAGIAGLSQLGAPLWVSPVFNGLALIIAVAFAVRRRDALSKA